MDALVEKAKEKRQILHEKAKDNRGAEMLEIAMVIGVVIGIYGAFQLLKNNVNKSITNAASKVK